MDDPNESWTRLTLTQYGWAERDREIAAFTPVWFHYGLPTVFIRGVLILDVAKPVAETRQRKRGGRNGEEGSG